MTRILLFAFIGLCFNFQASAQCCSAGNPSSDGGALGITKNSLTVSTSFLHSYSDTYFDGSTRSDYNYKEVQLDFNLLSVNYSLTDKIKLTTELGYFLAKKEVFTLFNKEKKAFGFGDAIIGIQYHAYSNKKKLLNIAHIFKLTLPVGEFDQIVNNIELPIDLQPSSGSYKFNPSVLITKNFFGSKYALSSFLSAEFSQRINTEKTDHKYGNLYKASFKVAHRTNNNLNTSISLQFQHRKKALNRGDIMESTGGTSLMLQPGISYHLKNNYSVNTSMGIPVYKNVNGTQLTNKYTFEFGISKIFHLKILKPQIDPKML